MARRLHGTVTVDVETHSAALRYELPPEEFVRLAGWKYADTGEVHISTSLDELREVLLGADHIVGHNIIAFDLPVVFGMGSDVPLELVEQDRVFDTWVHAPLVFPAPALYTDRKGRKALGNTPERMRKWFGLDELAHQLGVGGKTADLKALAKAYAPKDGDGKLDIDAGYGLIPVDDPEFREYLRGDVIAAEAIARALLRRGPLNAYARREHRIAGRAAVISANGFRVDREAAQARVDELATRREAILVDLQATYGLPTEGKAPWASKDGKEAIFKALGDKGVTTATHPDWPRTPKGALSLSGPALLEVTAGTEAEELGIALAELKGQRSLAALALASCHADGLAHPNITMLQRSGRWSTTEPGLTVWTARGPGAVEKRYFVPDSDDEVLLELDYSNADARVVAALSGDVRYAQRFEEGADGHMINAVAAWGEDVVASDPAGWRQKAKPAGHGWSYRIGARKLASTTGMPVVEAKLFLENLNATFTGVVAWQERVTTEAGSGIVTNLWGRTMFVELGREYTQGPALVGQSGTREIVCDAILRLPLRALRRLKAQIHDALVFSVPKANWEAWRDYLVRTLAAELDPPGGQRIAFPVSSGPPAANWYEAGH